jgi:uncharacterized membrane protein YfcA
LAIHHGILIFVAGLLAGAINSVAGGGSFLSFPALLFTGVPAVPANATTTFALWVGIVASGGAYRGRMNISARVLVPLVLTSVVGGILGALLLVHTPAQTFLHVIPWLMLATTLLFTFGRHLTRILAGDMSSHASNAALAGANLFELFVATYGGYFGGGIGIMNLAMFSALGMTDIHDMNALKVLLSVTTNGVATVTFVVIKAIFWPQALVMTGGAILGGYFGAHYAQKLPPLWIRSFIILIGVGMTTYFFVRYH